MTGGSSSSGSPTRSKSEFEVEVLPHARVLVCHGESGTTLGALAAGVPLVVTPLFADQPHNAGASPRSAPASVVEPRDGGAIRSAIDPVVLHDAIITVLANDASPRRRAPSRPRAALPSADTALTVLDAVR